jgi:hypothetical protein
MSSAKQLPSLECLREHFDLNEADGTLTRKTSYGQYKAGQVAGTRMLEGYYQMGIGGKRHLVHRVVFYMATGQDPQGYHVDHINGDPSDNRPDNLRLATQVENLRHRATMVSSNKSGYRNVSWNTRWKGWQVSVTVNGKRIQRRFQDIADAARCAAELRAKHFGEFAGVVA